LSSPRSLLELAPILREWPRVWLKIHTLQKQKLILVTIFLLVSHLLLLLGVLLFFFIILFYLIYITYKYNKLLLIW